VQQQQRRHTKEQQGDIVPHTTPYQTGDVFTLKSGGRPMTATWVGPVAFAPGIWLICEWLDASGKPQQGMFDAATLEPVAHA
jgi:uncharacterized protein YodC (DUF2158 family)